MPWPVLVFDIETIPDLQGMRATGLAQGDTDELAFAAWQASRAEQGKADFAPLHLQRVLVISCVFRNAEGLRIHSFVDREQDGQSQEGRIIQTFFSTVEKHLPHIGQMLRSDLEDVIHASDLLVVGLGGNVVHDGLVRHSRADQVVLDLVNLPNQAAISAEVEGLCW